MVGLEYFALRKKIGRALASSKRLAMHTLLNCNIPLIFETNVYLTSIQLDKPATEIAFWS